MGTVGGTECARVLATSYVRVHEATLIALASWQDEAECDVHVDWSRIGLSPLGSLGRMTDRPTDAEGHGEFKDKVTDSELQGHEAVYKREQLQRLARLLPDQLP